jgi:membrane protease YdiL (CAAX protease family)
VALSASLIIGGSVAALGLAGLFSQFSSSGPEDEAVRSMLLSVGPGWRYLYFALAPALFEESLFRGALLSSLRSWETGPATLVSAVTFAAIHASVPKFLPVALLGWVLAQAVIRTGNFWVAVAGHALHNGGVLWAVELGAPGTETASPILLLGAAVAGLVMVGVTLRLGFRRGGPTETGS